MRFILVVATIRNPRRKQTLPSFQNLAAVQLSWPVSIFDDYAVRRTTFVVSALRRHDPKVSVPTFNLYALVLVFAVRFRVSDFEYLQVGAWSGSYRFIILKRIEVRVSYSIARKIPADFDGN